MVNDHSHECHLPTPGCVDGNRQWCCSQLIQHPQNVVHQPCWFRELMVNSRGLGWMRTASGYPPISHCWPSILLATLPWTGGLWVSIYLIQSLFYPHYIAIISHGIATVSPFFLDTATKTYKNRAGRRDPWHPITIVQLSGVCKQHVNMDVYGCFTTL